jgi:hypothetical protein
MFSARAERCECDPREYRGLRGMRDAQVMSLIRGTRKYMSGLAGLRPLGFAPTGSGLLARTQRLRSGLMNFAAPRLGVVLPA